MMIVRAHDDDGVSAKAGTHGEGSASRGVQHASGCAVAKEECKHLMVQGGRLKRRERERGKEKKTKNDATIICVGWEKKR